LAEKRNSITQSSHEVVTRVAQKNKKKTKKNKKPTKKQPKEGRNPNLEKKIAAKKS